MTYNYNEMLLKVTKFPSLLEVLPNKKVCNKKKQVTITIIKWNNGGITVLYTKERS